MYLKLKESGELQNYLRKIGQDAVEMYEAIENQMLTAKDLPEDYPERVKALERIPLVAEEIVLNDLVFQPLPQQ